MIASRSKAQNHTIAQPPIVCKAASQLTVKSGRASDLVARRPMKNENCSSRYCLSGANVWRHPGVRTGGCPDSNTARLITGVLHPPSGGGTSEHEFR